MSDELPSNQPIYRHKPRTIPFQLTVGDGAVIDAVTAHIEKHIGPIAWVYHEIVSDLVHIDVHVIEPSASRNFYTLVTSGLSEAPMTTPPEYESVRFAELMICLPPDWPLRMNGVADAASPLKDEKYYWPIRLLKATARMPHEYDTWISHGHTISNGDPPRPYYSGTKMEAVMLLPSIVTSKGFWKMTNGDRTTYFFSLYPLYAEEMAYKLEHGSDGLIEKFEDARVTDVLNPTRKNTCRRKRFRLF